MDPERLRSKILDDIEKMLDPPRILRPFVNEEDRKLLRAQRAYWTRASREDMEMLVALYNNTFEGPPQEEWLKGGAE